MHRDALVRFEFGDAIGAGERRCFREHIRIGALRHELVREVVEDSGIRLGEPDRQCVIRRIERRDGGIAGFLRTLKIRRHQRIESEFEILRSDRFSILKFRVRIEMEDDRLVVGRLPLFGDVGREVAARRQLNET